MNRNKNKMLRKKICSKLKITVSNLFLKGDSQRSLSINVTLPVHVDLFIP